VLLTAAPSAQHKKQNIFMQNCTAKKACLMVHWTRHVLVHS